MSELALKLITKEKEERTGKFSKPSQKITST